MAAGTVNCVWSAEPAATAPISCSTSPRTTTTTSWPWCWRMPTSSPAKGHGRKAGACSSGRNSRVGSDEISDPEQIAICRVKVGGTHCNNLVLLLTLAYSYSPVSWQKQFKSSYLTPSTTMALSRTPGPSSSPDTPTPPRPTMPRS